MAQDLVGFLHESSQRWGTKPALYMKLGFRYRSWSYADMWTESGKVATLLQAKGIKPGDRVAIWGPNTPQWVFAFFGTLRAGALPVPVDLRSDEAFVARVVDKSRPTLGFASRFAPGAGAALGIDLIVLEELEALTKDLGEPQEVTLDPNDVAEIMFTSGTTGDPKGVMLTHANILSNLAALREFLPGESYYRVVSLLPLSHMFEQIGGLYLAFACGADVTYLSSMQPASIMKTMKERRVVTMLLVPQVLDLFMKGIEAEVDRTGKRRLWDLMHRIAPKLPMSVRRKLFGSVHRKLGGSLEFFAAAGAALDPETGRKWSNLGVKMMQGYGATETSPVITMHPITNPRYDSVGFPLPGVEVKIADDGEVVVKGPNVTPGYWEAPEQTAAVLEDGWYKTGDIGSFDAEGYLHLSGRKKDMIVLATGQNVFPDDIERILNNHPAIAGSAIVGLKRDGAPQVHAAVVVRDDGDPAEAVRWTNAQLAEHQRISGFTIWPGDELPRTHTFKVKKHEVIKAIEAMGQDDAPAAPERDAKAPVTADQILADFAGVALADLQGHLTLGEGLGMDSLSRVALLSTIEEQLRAYIDDSAVTAETTVEQFLALVESAAGTPVQFGFPGWGRRLWARGVRGLVQRGIVFPALKMTYGVKVTGSANFDGIQGPIMLASNHALHLDNGVLLKALPGRIRRKLAIAASSHMFKNRVQGILIPLLGNGFPFAKEGPVRPSLENLGHVLDDGWSVLIYPEGELTVGGPMKPFKAGIGFIATQARVPVIPMRLEINRFGFPAYIPFLRRGSLHLYIGEPLTFDDSVTNEEAAEAIEKAVAAL
jgi:long-chain acyl-CoA synthetase